MPDNLTDLYWLSAVFSHLSEPFLLVLTGGRVFHRRVAVQKCRRKKTKQLLRQQNEATQLPAQGIISPLCHMTRGDDESTHKLFVPAVGNCNSMLQFTSEDVELFY